MCSGRIDHGREENAQERERVRRMVGVDALATTLQSPEVPLPVAPSAFAPIRGAILRGTATVGSRQPGCTQRRGCVHVREARGIAFCANTNAIVSCLRETPRPLLAPSLWSRTRVREEQVMSDLPGLERSRRKALRRGRGTGAIVSRGRGQSPEIMGFQGALEGNERDPGSSRSRHRRRSSHPSCPQGRRTPLPPRRPREKPWRRSSGLLSRRPAQ